MKERSKVCAAERVSPEDTGIKEVARCACVGTINWSSGGKTVPSQRVSKSVGSSEVSFFRIGVQRTLIRVARVTTPSVMDNDFDRLAVQRTRRRMYP